MLTRLFGPLLFDALVVGAVDHERTGRDVAEVLAARQARHVRDDHPLG
jgi:hypothetical protein